MFIEHILHTVVGHGGGGGQTRLAGGTQRSGNNKGQMLGMASKGCVTVPVVRKGFPEEVTCEGEEQAGNYFKK